MRAWAKRMIWFFGYNIVVILSEWHAPYDFKPDATVSGVRFLILIIPLLFMSDDKEQGDTDG